jgi:hypothetical protein
MYTNIYVNKCAKKNTSNPYYCKRVTEDKIWNRLQIVQNKSLRAALNLPHFTWATYIHKLTSIPYIRSYVTELTGRALVRSQMMEDEVTEQNIFFLLDAQQWTKPINTPVSLFLFVIVFPVFLVLSKAEDLCVKSFSLFVYFKVN